MTPKNDGLEDGGDGFVPRRRRLYDKLLTIDDESTQDVKNKFPKGHISSGA
jgi:hypothetical protein